MSETQKYGTMMQSFLQVPPTEIEVADTLSLVVSMYGSASSVAQTIRRLAFQREMLLQENGALLRMCRQYEGLLTDAEQRIEQIKQQAIGRSDELRLHESHQQELQAAHDLRPDGEERFARRKRRHDQ